MGYVLQVLLALVTLAAPEFRLEVGAPRPWIVAVLLLAPHGLGFVVGRFLAGGRPRLAGLAERLLGPVPVLIQLTAVVAAGWLASVESWSGLEVGLGGWPGISLLLGLLPFLVGQLAAIDARARLFGARAHRAVRGFHTRLFASALLPFLVYLGAASLVGLSEPLRVHVEEVSLHGAVFSGVLLLAFVLGLPTLLRGTWDTVAVEQGDLRDLLEDLARRARFRCRELLRWRTGNQMANAAIVGFTPQSRIVVFSDVLLDQLTPSQVAAVFAHEIGHAQHNHAVVFASWALGLFLGADFLLVSIGVVSATITIAALGGTLLVWYLAFGFVSRRFELEADLTSLELIGESESLIGALAAVGGAHAHRRSSWRHFSNHDRIAFLLQAERDPGVGARLRRRLRIIGRVGIVLFLATAALELHRMWGARNEERLVAELRLGRYDSAAELLDDVVGADEQLSRLVILAAGLPPEERDLEDLEARALAAFQEGRPQRAADLIELALLRGSAHLEPVRTAIEAGAQGLADPGELSEPWRAALAQ